MMNGPDPHAPAVNVADAKVAVNALTALQPFAHPCILAFADQLIAPACGYAATRLAHNNENIAAYDVTEDGRRCFGLVWCARKTHGGSSNLWRQQVSDRVY